MLFHAPQVGTITYTISSQNFCSNYIDWDRPPKSFRSNYEMIVLIDQSVTYSMHKR